jgi:hypothetical protein
MVGTYSLPGKGLDHWLYFGIIQDGKRTGITFHKFMDLNNFLDYFSDKEEADIVKKSEKAQSKGKELSVCISLISHKITMKNGKFIFIGEAYHPTFKMVTSTYAIHLELANQLLCNMDNSDDQINTFLVLLIAMQCKLCMS